MHYQEWWSRSVPSTNGMPPLAEPAGQAYDSAQGELRALGVPDQLRDALYWVFRIAEETEQLNSLAASVPWLDRLAMGFTDEGEAGQDPSFGIICYTNVPEDVAPSAITDSFQGPTSINVGDHSFPAVIRVGARVPQVGITSPSQALVTIWSRSRRAQQGGWLVPAHAVDPSQKVGFSDGTSGTVTDSWGSCIDAMLVTPTKSVVAPTNLCKATRGITPGMKVSVVNSKQQSFQASIVDVDVNLGVVRHHLFPVRFSYDWPCSAQGDSGALVVASPCGKPAGMHQGMFKSASASGVSTLAYALSLYQLEDYGGLVILK